MSRKVDIELKLTEHLLPVFLSVEDESQNHHIPEGAQTHFKVIAVSSQFKGQNLVARHKMLNQLLKKEFATGLHALSMHLYTEEEWQLRKDSVLQSPSCKDGYKNR